MTVLNDIVEAKKVTLLHSFSAEQVLKFMRQTIGNDYEVYNKSYNQYVIADSNIDLIDIRFFYKSSDSLNKNGVTISDHNFIVNRNFKTLYNRNSLQKFIVDILPKRLSELSMAATEIKNTMHYLKKELDNNIYSMELLDNFDYNIKSKLTHREIAIFFKLLASGEVVYNICNTNNFEDITSSYVKKSSLIPLIKSYLDDGD